MPERRSAVVFTLLVLLGINTMNFFDRQVLGVVAEPVRTALQLDDKSLGWLGTAFILLYAVIGIPLGHWADVGRRTRLLAIAVLIWSGLTALSAFAWSFWSLFVLRLGVGVGEAGCAPAANSLVGDLVPAEKRARAIAIFMLGLPLGLGLSFIVSGYVARQWGWQAAFLVASVPGFVLGIVAFFLPEPERGTKESRAVGGARRAGSGIAAVLRIPTMWWIILSGALHNFNMYAIGYFLAPYLQRYHGRDVSEAGQIGGLVYGFGGIGIFLGGWACDWMARRRVSGRLEVSTFALAIGLTCIYLALEQPRGSVAAFQMWMLPGCMLLYVYYSGVYAAIQDIVEPALRGTAMGVYFFAMYLLGGALGPVGTGWASDYFARRAAGAEGIVTEQARAIGLQHALYLVPCLGIALVVVMFIASRTIGRDHKKLQEWMAAQS